MTAMTSEERLEKFKETYPEEAITLKASDLGVVVAYFVIIIGIGIIAMCRSNRGTLGGFFLAGRSMWFLPIGASLFVSNIGTEHFIGLSGSGAAQGISVGAWEFNAILLLQLLGWIFIPVYIACGTYTMPQYLTKRFGGQRMRVYFAILSLILYIFTKCSGDLFTGALFIQQSLRWNLYLCIFVLVIITGILTMTGGLTAVIYTDTMQACLMVGGGLTLMGMSFYRIGGYDGLVRKYPNATTQEIFRPPNNTCWKTDTHAFQLLRSADDDYMPWAGFLLGQTPGSIWYWCADQVIVQRLLAAKSLSHAQGATLMAGFIKILPLFMMVMPGMISRIEFPDEVACVDPEICNYVCQSKAGCSSIAYPRLVLDVMPEGLRGLMMAVMIAALMSDLDSIFNSASTLFTVDIYTRIRKHCSLKEQMVVGRLFILFMVGVSIAWVPVVKEAQGGQIFIYIQEITDYLAPPFAAVYLLAVLVPRVNEQTGYPFWVIMQTVQTQSRRSRMWCLIKAITVCFTGFGYANTVKGAFWSLMLAFVTGVIRMILVFVYHDTGGCGEEDPRPDVIKNFHYMYFALFITLLTAAAAIIISLLTEKPAEKHLVRTTFWTRHAELPPEELEPPRSEEKSADGFTNIVATADDNKTNVFTVEEKKVFRDPNLDMVPARSKEETVSCPEKTMNYICGFHQHGEIDQEAEAALKKHMEKVASLRQNKYAKIGLNIGLVLILCIGTFLYIFWSVWKYEPN